MRNTLPKIVFVSTLALTGLAMGACTADIHDNTINIPDAKVTFNTDVDSTTIAPGQAVPITLTAENVYLIEPSETPPAAHASDAGHFQIYLDDVGSTALAITAKVKTTVTVPANTKAGPHKLICRVHKHNGESTTTIVEVNITVVIKTGPVDGGVAESG
ncbi:MAG: hypothetical protein JNL79_16835 [Myxococcales bacterium]|nr:hypothetical protein [Myxococcales bacterium]